MVIQITTRCNMSCERCIYDCTEIGEDMLFETFQLALQAAITAKSFAVITGGEPLLHQQFEDFIEYALSIPKWNVQMEDIHQSHFGRISVSTNGSISNKAIWLAQKAQKGELIAGLSLDDFHDPISTEVIKAFIEGKENSPSTFVWGGNQPDLRVVRILPTAIIGRAKENNLGEIELCPFPSPHVLPNGLVRACGCLDAPIIGHISKLPEKPISSFYCHCGRDKEAEKICNNPSDSIRILKSAYQRAGLNNKLLAI